MNPSLVMSEEGRKTLMARRLEKRRKQLLLQKKDQYLGEEQEEGQQKDGEKQEDIKYLGKEKEQRKWCEKRVARELENCEIKEEEVEEEKKEKEIIHHQGTFAKADLPKLTCEDINIISVLLRLVRSSLVLPEFFGEAGVFRPRDELTFAEGSNTRQTMTGNDIEHLIFALCKGLGRFYTLVKENMENGRQQQQQDMTLKGAVAIGVILYATHQFQEESERWPRKVLSPSCKCPEVTLEQVLSILPAAYHRIAFAAFMRKNCSFFTDEVVTVISLMVALYDAHKPDRRPQDYGLKHEPNAAFTEEQEEEEVRRRREAYLGLLQRYLTHKHQNTTTASSITAELNSCLQEVRVLATCLTNADHDNPLSTAVPQATHHTPFNAPLKAEWPEEDVEGVAIVKADPAPPCKEESFDCVETEMTEDDGHIPLHTVFPRLSPQACIYAATPYLPLYLHVPLGYWQHTDTSRPLGTYWPLPSFPVPYASPSWHTLPPPHGKVSTNVLT